MFGPSLEISAAALLSFAPLAPVAAAVLPPVLILVLCVVAGIGTVLLLPSRKEAALRKIGGAVILAAGLILVALLVRAAAGTGGMGVYFWIFAAIALLSALRVITHPKPVYSALYFVLTVFASAGLFVLLWAEFMAVALIIIYAGAILVTYVFVIMLAAEATPTSGPMAGLAEHDAISREPLMACVVGFALMGVLLFVIFEKADGAVGSATPQAAVVVVEGAPPPGSSAIHTFTPEGGVQELGAYLFSSQLVNLELAGLILTVAMIGAIVIARRRVVGTDAATHAIGGNETIVGPATPTDDDPHTIPVYGTENPRQKAYPET
ncbi:MAG TPA: NADH-quinone oxidoreductase subunit J [Tepidisphaeraceae bacterium]|nr:NADH-quinone oxidoreductase subunit J [Tepidisphaeraceae bacterium]